MLEWLAGAAQLAAGPAVAKAASSQIGKTLRYDPAYQSLTYPNGDVPPNLPHIMVVSGRTSRDGRPLIIHNIGSGTREEDRLFEFKLTGHYRLPPDGGG